MWNKKSPTPQINENWNIFIFTSELLLKGHIILNYLCSLGNKNRPKVIVCKDIAVHRLLIIFFSLKN